MLNENLNKIINCIEEVTEKKVNIDDYENVKLTEYGMNSIAFVKLVIKLEKIFGIKFDDSELNFKKYIHLKNLVGLLEKKFDAK